MFSEGVMKSAVYDQTTHVSALMQMYSNGCGESSAFAISTCTHTHATNAALNTAVFNCIDIQCAVYMQEILQDSD